MAKLQGTYNVTKASDGDTAEAQNLYGWFNIAASADGTPVVDHHDDVIHIDDLEAAAHQFVMDSRVSGVDHNGGDPDGDLVASIVFTDDVIAALATDPVTGEQDELLFKTMAERIPRGWFGAFHISDRAAWIDARDGNRHAFSIEGYAETVEEI